MRFLLGDLLRFLLRDRVALRVAAFLDLLGDTGEARTRVLEGVRVGAKVLAAVRLGAPVWLAVAAGVPDALLEVELDTLPVAD